MGNLKCRISRIQCLSQTLLSKIGPVKTLKNYEVILMKMIKVSQKSFIIGIAITSDTTFI